jgi:hypothetical protein
LHGKVSKVSIGRHKLTAGVVSPVEGLAHDKDVVSLSEGVSVVGNGLDDDLRLISDSLIGGGTVVIPVGNICEAGDLVGECAALGAEGEAGTINPKILSDDVAELFEVEQFARILVVKV